ncbi:crocetin glucosyltransferase, chloroplastic-like [Momordica charantia]|uniref:Mogroside I-E synthase n=1 Tax=Momordica charantia TaxID=3673 RepID=A0A6J1D0N5_MOMCH|nr:crocetin glucosyltransferase, chloroplastic-like [Momordica charantia]
MADLALSFNLPSALFWNQSASVFSIYHHFFHAHRDPIRKLFSIPNGRIQLPGLPLLSSDELPSLCEPANPNSLVFQLFDAHFRVLNRDPHLKILINSFEELERDALRAIPNVDLVTVGPVIQREIPSDASTKAHVAWLNSKPKSSVVYVSFGSIAALSKPQLEEIAGALLDSGRPFLWVMRKTVNGVEDEAVSCRAELEARGKIVSWCSQVEILSNPATGCFVTHCGWNSSLESIACGVPVVAFPQWTDQGTNAKIIEELSESGVRLRANGDDIVERGEIKRCLELVMDPRAEGEILRRNVGKWKELAKKATGEGGSSHVNIGAFVDEVSNAAAL